jgi:hypothetical protein
MKTLSIIAVALALGVPASALAQSAGRPAAGEVRRSEAGSLETRRIDTGRIDTGRDAGRTLGTRIDSGPFTGSRIRRPEVRGERPNHHARRRWNAAHQRRDPERRPDVDPSRRRASAESPRRGR